MKIRHVYLLFGVPGTALHYSQFMPVLREQGLDFSALFHQLFAGRISAFFAWDVIVSAAVLASLTVGVSLGLPMFLWLRQPRLEAQKARNRRGGDR